MIQHVAIECARRDRDALVAFWGALGFEEVDPPASLGDRAAWLESGGTQIHLLWAEHPRVAGHVAVQVPDHDAAITALRAAGFMAEARTQHWGAARSYAHAPGGHVVELFQVSPSERAASG